jgi:diacylglycerol kinase
MSFITNRARSFYYASQGIVAFFKREPNGQIQLLAAIAVTAAGFYFKISGIEWCIQTLCIAFVLSLEMVNSAIEKHIDSLTTDFKPELKYIKDVAAGAVLISALASLAVASIIYFPKIKEYWF